VRILKPAAHFHLDFMHEGLTIPNLPFYFPRPTEQRAKFTRPPANKGRLIFALKTVPSAPRAFQPRHRSRAIRRSRLTQWPLVDQDQMTVAGRWHRRSIAQIVSWFRFGYSRSSLSPHHRIYATGPNRESFVALSHALGANASDRQRIPKLCAPE
jgi:hypothetical protein